MTPYEATAILAAAHAASGVQWGDVPTWVLAVIALLALIAAVAAYFKQADAAKKLAQQVDLQRDQLKDQQEANSKQAEVLEAQLHEIRLRERLIERQQAEAVTVKPASWTGRVPGIRSGSGTAVYEVEVQNGWHRPIRKVSACIQRTAEDGFSPASLAGQVIEMSSPLRQGQPQKLFTDETENPRWDLLRTDETVAFVFHFDIERHPGARITVRFTDDAGLYWQIDHDQSLTKLDTRDW